MSFSKAFFGLLDYHEGKKDGGLFHGLDDPESYKTANLNHRVQVDPAQLDLTQVGIVRLELLRHQEEKDPVEELETVQGGDSHEKKDSV